MFKYNYTWKNGLCLTSNQSLSFEFPLTKDMMFVNLETGKRFKVFSVDKAKENDRHNTDMPEDVVQTFDAGVLTEQQLAELRKRYEDTSAESKYRIDDNTM